MKSATEMRARHSTAMAKGIRKTVTLPGILAPTVRIRSAEFGYKSFSPYGLELICYDLRTCAKHSVTLQIALDTQSAQDAVDRELVERYRPGRDRDGLLVQLLKRAEQMQEAATRFRHAQRLPPLSVISERITIPEVLWLLVDLRWQEIGYPSLSAYITGLVRYDLMVGGPHLFTGADCRPEIQDALTRETVAARRAGQSRKILLDYLIERARGKNLSDIELDQIKLEIAQRLKSYAGPSRAHES